MQGIETFLVELKVVLNKSFPDSHIKYLLNTPRSLKANVILNADTFISIRYNSRNGRKDYALIYKEQRVFGYDNLKTWHVHPFGASNTHLPCDEPVLKQIFIEIKDICERLAKG